MTTNKIIGIILIVGGLLGLIYGGFSYTKKTNEAKLGSLQLSVQQKKTVNVPMWVGVGSVIVGGALLLAEQPVSESAKA